MNENYKYAAIIVTLLGALVGRNPDAIGQVNQETKFLRVGSLHSWFGSVGAEVELGRTGLLTDQLDGMQYPAQFPDQDILVGKALWIGTTNFNDLRAGQTFARKVITAGPRGNDIDTFGEVMPVSFRMVGRFKAPIVIVDGNRASANDLNDVVDEVNPDLNADRMIVNVLHTAIGLTIERKIFAFSQQNHDNYFVYDYVFKNTGIRDLDGQPIDNPPTLTDVIIHLQYRYGDGWEAFLGGWSPSNNPTWGRNAVHQVVGQDPNAANFEFRAQYSWFGLHSQWPVETWGAPDPATGRLGATNFMGVATLHADKSTSDSSDDPFQPTTTRFIGADVAPDSPQNSDQFDSDLMARKYDVMSAGHPDRTHAEAVGDGFADLFGTNPGGFSQAQGFGPYDIAVGDSIHIVLAEAVAGMSRTQAAQVGQTWFEDSPPFDLPGGGQTSDRDEYKRTWVQSGQDSLFQSFRRAIASFNAGLNVPQPPPPPASFEVASGGDRIVLNWADNAESWPTFDGYEVYRAVGRPDTFYTKIFETDGSNPVNSFDDTEAERGDQYYYYVVSKDDGSTNDVSPGTPLKSGKFYTMTSLPAFLRRPAEEGLSQARVVPNPFHISNSQNQFVGAPDVISFFGLPAVCTIKIFTERGDLVDTIQHSDGTGDEQWDSLTSSQQVIVSGVYIAHIEEPTGNATVLKFIVIR